MLRGSRGEKNSVSWYLSKRHDMSLTPFANSVFQASYRYAISRSHIDRNWKIQYFKRLNYPLWCPFFPLFLPGSFMIEDILSWHFLVSCRKKNQCEYSISAHFLFTNSILPKMIRTFFTANKFYSVTTENDLGEAKDFEIIEGIEVFNAPSFLKFFLYHISGWIVGWLV